MARTGRPAYQREQILAYADEMHSMGLHINKSRIARELHCSLRTVFRTLPRISMR